MLEKLAIALVKDADDWPDFNFETIWVESLKSGLYLVRSIPFFAEDIAPDDEVSAANISGVLTFSAVLKYSSNSVFVGVVKGDLDEFKLFIASAKLRIEYGFDASMFAVACSSDQLSQTRRKLRKMEKNKYLEFGELTIRK